jgi:hypothetical protein
MRQLSYTLALVLVAGCANSTFKGTSGVLHVPLGHANLCG